MREYNFLRLWSAISLLFIASCTRVDDAQLKMETQGSTFHQILTSADQSKLLEESVKPLIWGDESVSHVPTISIDPEITFQPIDGFGFTLTGGSAMLLSQMSSLARANLLNEMFGRNEGEIGVNYLRLSVGASDLDPEVYSYNDLSTGETDVELTRFSLLHEQEYLLPVLKEILAITPRIKILGSPSFNARRGSKSIYS